MFLITKLLLFELFISGISISERKFTERRRKGPCESNPCQNGALCISMLWTQPRYICSCTNRFRGLNCEIEDPCKSNPCLNNAECVNIGLPFKYERYECLCKEKTAGSNCEITDPCQSRPCQNDGTCIFKTNTPSHYSCLCKSNFTGKNCDLERDPCKINPCQNNGKCLYIDNSYNDYYQCACKNGFNGRYCENKYLIEEECKTPEIFKCKNFGVCFHNKYSNVKSCRCPFYYKGNQCESFDFVWVFFVISMIFPVVILIYLLRKKCFKKENRNLNDTLRNYCVEIESSCNSDINQIEQTENILSYQEALQTSSLIEPVPDVDFNLPSYDQAIKMKRF